MLGFLSHIEYHMRQIWVSKDLKKGEHNFKFEASAEDAHFTELSVGLPAYLGDYLQA